MHSLLLLLSVCSSLPGGLGFGVGLSLSSLSPVDDGYTDRFLTPGTCYGLSVSLDAPGIMVLRMGSDYFSKESTSGWDGEVSSVLFWAFPSAQLRVIDGFGLFAGPGIAGTTGSYSGTDDFGSFVEADGSGVGFAASFGADVVLWGPLTGRIEYRRTWMDMKTDRVRKDGDETVIYPAVETDLGYSQYSFTLEMQLSAVDDGQ